MSGESETAQGDDGLESSGGDRRSFLKKAGVGVAAAWVAPTVLSSAAHAQGSVVPPLVFLAAGTEGASTNQTVNAGYPAPTGGLLAGDLLVAAITSNGVASITAPTGWTEIVNLQRNGTGLVGQFTENRLRVWTRTAAGGETGNLTFTRSNNGTLAQFRAVMVAYRNQSVATPTGTPTTGTDGDDNSKIFPAVTSTLNNSIILRVGMHAQGSATWNAVPGGYNQRHESPNGDRGILIFDSDQATAGAAAAVTVGTSANQVGAMSSIVINPLP